MKGWSVNESRRSVPAPAPSNARCSAQRQSGFDGGGGGICCRACLTDLAMRVMYAGASWVCG